MQPPTATNTHDWMTGPHWAKAMTLCGGTGEITSFALFQQHQQFLFKKKIHYRAEKKWLNDFGLWNPKVWKLYFDKDEYNQQTFQICPLAEWDNWCPPPSSCMQKTSSSLIYLIFSSHAKKKRSPKALLINIGLSTKMESFIIQRPFFTTGFRQP